MQIDDVKYAESGDLSIAWQRYGDPNGVPVVAVPPLATNIDLLMGYPPSTPYFERWGSFANVVHFDKRGCGMSDRTLGAALTLEERMDDIRAVMDSAGFERAAVLGLSEGGPLSMLFAATYPERTSALVLQSTFARLEHAPDYTHGVTPELAAMFTEILATTWGTPETVMPGLFTPSHLLSAEYLDWVRRFQRNSATPATIRALNEVNFGIDVRHIVGTISCPTMVLHGSDDLVVPLAHGAWLAEHIPGATFVVYESPDHWPSLHAVTEQLDAIEEFLTGAIAAAPANRVLATVLFTDIVDSTKLAASLGDRRWRELLETHDRLVQREVDRAGGYLVKSTGDGVLARFDSPARAIRAACAARDAVAPHGVEIRGGLHTGEVEQRGDDLAGIAVHLGARVSALAGAGEVLVSASVPPLVFGSGIVFDDRGEHELKGIPGSWRVFAVASV